jgi:aspartyl-tRNA(Asn)/glutamyl-tRNA(Gln) amidotransferase subunit A
MESGSLRRAARTAREQPRFVEDRIERSIESRRPEWNAYRAFRDEPVRWAARWSADALRRAIDLGPLQGAAVSVKDIFGVAGERTYAGTPRPLPPSFEREGPVIAGLRRQGAVVTGKTHTVELAFGGLGPNGHWGTPRNPWDGARHRVPGGSSSGAAVSLLEGSADLALGSDTAGSIRIPAAFCGLVGLKLTAGRWSTEGVVPLSSTLDSIGLMARTVEDVAFGFFALDGDFGRARADLRLEPVEAPTLAVHERGFWDGATNDVDDTVRTALRELERGGCRVESTRVPEVGAALRLFGKGSVTGVECLSFVRRELPQWESLLEPNVAPRIRAAETVSGCEYVRRRARIDSLGRRARARIAPGSVLVAPTVVRSAPSLEEVSEPGDYRRINLVALRNTSVANTLGWCALSVPCGLDAQRLPIGLMLMAPGGYEVELLAAGVAVERVLGTAAERFGPLPGAVA